MGMLLARYRKERGVSEMPEPPSDEPKETLQMAEAKEQGLVPEKPVGVVEGQPPAEDSAEDSENPDSKKKKSKK